MQPKLGRWRDSKKYIAAGECDTCCCTLFVVGFLHDKDSQGGNVCNEHDQGHIGRVRDTPHHKQGKEEQQQDGSQVHIQCRPQGLGINAGIIARHNASGNIAAGERGDWVVGFGCVCERGWSQHHHATTHDLREQGEACSQGSYSLASGVEKDIVSTAIDWQCSDHFAIN